MIEVNSLEIGDVVQLNDGDGFHAMCFMTITEFETWGARGYILTPERREPGETQDHYYFGAKWDEMTRIGKAKWLLPLDWEMLRDG
jgi:hypothetical protein